MLMKRLQFGRKQQQAFLEDLYALVKDGVPVAQAVNTIRQISYGSSKRVATDIVSCIAKGQLMADGMRGWFGVPIVELIRMGESGGDLEKTLQAAAESYQQSSNNLAVMINAMLYPTMVLLLALTLLIVIKDTVLVSFAEIKPVSMWPMVGQHLYSAGNFLQYWWWLVLLLVIGVLLSVAYVLQQYTGQIRYFLDGIPVLSLYRRSIAAWFMQTLGMLVANGVMLKKALEIMHGMARPYLAWHLLMMEYRLSGGKDNIADVLDTQLILPQDIVRLKIVAKGKGFADALLSLGRQATQRNAKVVQTTAKIMGAALLILSAVIAGNIVLGIYAVGSTVAS